MAESEDPAAAAQYKELCEFVHETNLVFAGTFDQMPPVPRPLSDEYRYITETALGREIRSAAPYKETGLATDISAPLATRKLGRLQCWCADTPSLRALF